MNGPRSGGSGGPPRTGNRKKPTVLDTKKNTETSSRELVGSGRGWNQFNDVNLGQMFANSGRAMKSSLAQTMSNLNGQLSQIQKGLSERGIDPQKVQQLAGCMQKCTGRLGPAVSGATTGEFLPLKRYITRCSMLHATLLMIFESDPFITCIKTQGCSTSLSLLPLPVINKLPQLALT